VQRTRIKICGLQSPELACQACDAGADAVGLVFYAPSSRHLEIPQAAEIRASMPAFVDAVAVVVNPEVDYVRRIIDEVGVSLIQFHGEESNAFCSQFDVPFIKALRVSDDLDLSREEVNYADASGILLDTHVKNVYGGSGKTFDWNRANYGGQKPIVLAGGLDAENVEDSLKVANPYAVDVSSGVETNGKKDVEKMRSFCRNVMSYNIS